MITKNLLHNLLLNISHILQKPSDFKIKLSTLELYERNYVNNMFVVLITQLLLLTTDAHIHKIT